MLKRLYVDNYVCFVNFELSFGPRQLILGPNGSGKSSLWKGLEFVRDFVSVGGPLNDDDLAKWTRWSNQPEQTWELEADVAGHLYIYRLVLERGGSPQHIRVSSEKLTCDKRAIFEFQKGEVHLFNDNFEQKVGFPLSPSRAALAIVDERKDNRLLTQFKRWLADLHCFQINPYAMEQTASKEDFHPRSDLANIAAWYRNLAQADWQSTKAFQDDLARCLDSFDSLNLDAVSETARQLVVRFTGTEGKLATYRLAELSDGQRCLLALYLVLHFLVRRGRTVILDEPDNFISLREIQPWLSSLDDAVDEAGGQAILISHHPEILNQWAPEVGVRFIREGAGPMQAKPFDTSDTDAKLPPSEIVARGWDDE